LVTEIEFLAALNIWLCSN